MGSNSGPLSQLREFSRERLFPRRHTALLVALFATRPLIGDAGFAPVAFSLALIVLMLVSLYTVQVDELVGERETLQAQKKRTSMIGWLLVIPAVMERFAIVTAKSPSVVIAGVVFWLLFFYLHHLV